mmetsp:Transcript_23831/g.53897  ORF Transcript_23831/g.53897 Transcript_23831/m.53897 type:complete len:84 (+) Transcript_23831:101-352(+)
MLQRIGRVVTTSPFLESRSSSGLFFKHQRKEEDYALRPHWLQQVSASQSFGQTPCVPCSSVGSAYIQELVAKGLYEDLEPSSL